MMYCVTEERLQNVNIVLKRLKEFRIKLTAEKSGFFSKEAEVKYLGKNINSEGYGDDLKIKISLNNCCN